MTTPTVFSFRARIIRDINETDLEDYYGVLDYLASFPCYGKGLTLVENEIIGTGRWCNYLRNVYRIAAEGFVAHFAVEYAEGATERQEDHPECAEAYPVIPESVTVIRYRPDPRND